MTKWEFLNLERIQNVNNFNKQLEGKRWDDLKKGDEDRDELRLNELGQDGWQIYQVETQYDVVFKGKGFSHLTTYYMRRQIDD